jgi:hypothetical protein
MKVEREVVKNKKKNLLYCYIIMNSEIEFIKKTLGRLKDEMEKLESKKASEINADKNFLCNLVNIFIDLLIILKKNSIDYSVLKNKYENMYDKMSYMRDYKMFPFKRLNLDFKEELKDLEKKKKKKIKNMKKKVFGEEVQNEEAKIENEYIKKKEEFEEKFKSESKVLEKELFDIYKITKEQLDDEYEKINKQLSEMMKNTLLRDFETLEKDLDDLYYDADDMKNDYKFKLHYLSRDYFSSFCAVLNNIEKIFNKNMINDNLHKTFLELKREIQEYGVKEFNKIKSFFEQFSNKTPTHEANSMKNQIMLQSLKYKNNFNTLKIFFNEINDIDKIDNYPYVLYYYSIMQMLSSIINIFEGVVENAVGCSNPLQALTKIHETINSIIDQPGKKCNGTYINIHNNNDNDINIIKRKIVYLLDEYVNNKSKHITEIEEEEEVKEHEIRGGKIKTRKTKKNKKLRKNRKSRKVNKTKRVRINKRKRRTNKRH